MPETIGTEQNQIIRLHSMLKKINANMIRLAQNTIILLAFGTRIQLIWRKELSIYQAGCDCMIGSDAMNALLRTIVIGQDITNAGNVHTPFINQRYRQCT